MVSSVAERDTPPARGLTSGKNGPELWSAILARFPPEAVIAGGAVRDFLLGVEPKDIDVFLPVDKWPACGFPGFASLGANRDDEYQAMPDIAVVQRGEVEGHQVDIVGVVPPAQPFSPAALVATFDFGIARCWFDGAEIHDTPEAKADREGRVVTCHLIERLARAHDRFERFNTRLGGGWRFDAPPRPVEPVMDGEVVF